MANLIGSIIVIGAMLIVPALMARLLRTAGCPGWSVLGGLLAGLLIGPQILVRLMPSTYERFVQGGPDQLMTLRSLIVQQDRDLAASRHAGLDQETIDQTQSHYETQVKAARASLETARWNHQRPQRVAVVIIVGLLLLGSGLMSMLPHNVRALLPAATSIGLWSATLPAVGIIAPMVWWWDYSLAEALFVAAALAIGPWALTAMDREAADDAEVNGAALIQTAGRIASILAIVLAIAGVVLARGAAELFILLPLLALPLGWCMPGRLQNSLFEHIIIPSLAAMVAVRMEVLGNFAIGALIVVLLLSDDGRWLAAFIGAMIPGGRHALRTLRLTLGSMSAGPTQLAVTALGAHFNLIPASLILPLALGAALIEVTAPARRGLARKLAETEEELNHIDLD